MLYEIGVCVDTPYIVNDIADDCGYTTGTERKECGAEEAKAGGLGIQGHPLLQGLHETLTSCLQRRRN